MFWAVMLIVMAIVICASFLAGQVINNRRDSRQLSKQEMMTMTKVSGALKHRKSNR